MGNDSMLANKLLSWRQRMNPLSHGNYFLYTLFRIICITELEEMLIWVGTKLCFKVSKLIILLFC